MKAEISRVVIRRALGSDVDSGIDQSEIIAEKIVMEDAGSDLIQTETLKWGISWLATVSTIGLFLSGISLCQKVKKQGDTKDVTMAPFLITSANCAFWLKYGLLRADSTLIVVNATGFFLELVYLTYYYSYTGISSRRTVTKQILAFYFLFSAVFYWGVYLTPAPLSAIGYIGSCTAMGVYAAPLATVAKVIQLKSSEFMSFPLSAVGLVVSIEWLLYGLIIADSFLTVPNVVGVFLGVFQMALFAKYPSKSKGTSQTNLPV